MRTITIDATFRHSFTVEVDDDYEAPDEARLELGDDIHGVPIIEQIDTSGAELVDWTVTG